eukprot:TRINITY_DN4264_c0_g2_i4.p2 TRINITY_DN4264_c0_g2~~TRINITY_DN4264_c0_g2_i4.p2  ORF type:complete len:397 (-),score=123.16 TRINITY_DN4264_c0_g2_i4:798-1895(-)
MASPLVTFTLVVSITILTTSAQFICNNYKNQAACDGSTASDGICQWGLFGCSSARPLPSPTVVPRQPPKIVCPAFVAEAACIYDPCKISQMCFANAAAVCVPNTCVGDFEYLGSKLTDPCSAVWVDLETMEVVDCNVKDIFREADEDARPKEGEEAEEEEAQMSQLQAALQASSSAPSPDTPQVSGMLLGLPPLTSPQVVDEEAQETEAITTEEEEEEEALVPEPEPEAEQIIFFPQSLTETDETEEEEAEEEIEADAEAEALARAIAEADGELIPTEADEEEEEEEEDEEEPDTVPASSPSMLLGLPQLTLPSLSLGPIQVEGDEPVAVDDSEMPIAKQALGEEEEAFFKSEDVADAPAEEGRA